MRREVGYKSVLDFGREAKVYPPHDYGDYPTKLLPQVVRVFVKRFSNPGEELEKENRPVRYRRRLIEKLRKTSQITRRDA